MTKKMMNKFTSLVIPATHRCNMLMVTIGRCMMTKRLSLLSIGGALVWSLCVFDVGNAVQTERNDECCSTLAMVGDWLWCWFFCECRNFFFFQAEDGIRYLTPAEIKGTAN